MPSHPSSSPRAPVGDALNADDTLAGCVATSAVPWCLVPGAPVFALGTGVVEDLAKVYSAAVRAVMSLVEACEGDLSRLVLLTGNDPARRPRRTRYIDVASTLAPWGAAIPVGPEADAEGWSLADEGSARSMLRDVPLDERLPILLGAWWIDEARRQQRTGRRQKCHGQADGTRRSLDTGTHMQVPASHGVFTERDVVVVVADGPAGLSTTAPMSDLPEAHRLEALLDALLASTSGEGDGHKTVPAVDVLRWLDADESVAHAASTAEAAASDSAAAIERVGLRGASGWRWIADEVLRCGTVTRDAYAAPFGVAYFVAHGWARADHTNQNEDSDGEEGTTQ